MLPHNFFCVFLEFTLAHLFRFAEDADPSLVRDYRKEFAKMPSEYRRQAAELFSREYAARKELGDQYSQKWSNDYFQLACRFGDIEALLRNAKQNPADRYFLSDNV